MHSVFIAIVWYISTNTLFNSAEDNKKYWLGPQKRLPEVNQIAILQILSQSQGLLSQTVDVNPLV